MWILGNCATTTANLSEFVLMRVQRRTLCSMWVDQKQRMWLLVDKLRYRNVPCPLEAFVVMLF